MKQKKTKKGKLAGTRKCERLDEDDCKLNSRCSWNEFHIEEFDMNTSKGKEKLYELKESLMKKYTKEELIKYFGSEDPSFFQIYLRAKKEYDNGLRGLCGNKMFMRDNLSNILKDRVKKNFPDHRSKKTKGIKVIEEKDLVEDLLKEAMKKNKPDKEIKEIIDKYGLTEKDLQKLYDKENKELFSGIDRILSVNHDEVSNLIDLADAEVKLEKKEDSELQARLDRLKGFKSGAGKGKKKKRSKKTKRGSKQNGKCNSKSSSKKKIKKQSKRKSLKRKKSKKKKDNLFI